MRIRQVGHTIIRCFSGGKVKIKAEWPDYRATFLVPPKIQLLFDGANSQQILAHDALEIAHYRS